MTTEIWGLIPLKALNFAKQRLAGSLAPEERAGLFMSMVRDVVRALQAARSISRVVIVTADRDAYGSLASDHVELIDERPGGLSRAVEDAARYAGERGATGIVMLPGDLPLVTAEDIDVMAELVTHQPAIAISPDVDENGTNCIAVSPPDLMRYHFGGGSFHRHCHEARARGAAPTVKHLPGLALDVDTVADLAWLLDRLDETPVHSCTRAYVISHDMASRLGHPHNTRSLSRKA
ncbi:MAG: 2-phospho-L-lactate guanylyltransferase [Gammaproteobacteria bacterium]|nr:2-phospho-L-lactate guanylyltransferase [Gammaproteobacteria bacterium]